MSRNSLIGIVVIVAIGAGAWWYLNQSSTTVPSFTQNTNETPVTSNTPATTQTTSASAPALRIVITTPITAPIISGTAVGTSYVLLSFTRLTATAMGGQSHGSGLASVHNGSWSYAAKDDFFEPGDYKVSAYPTDASGQVSSYSNPAAVGNFSVPTSTAEIQGTIDTTSPTITGTLKHMIGGGLSIVIVQGNQELPSKPSNPAKLTNVVAYVTSGMGGDINTDYKTQYSYPLPTLNPGTYTVGLYLNTLFVQDAIYKGFTLLASTPLAIH